MPPIMAALKQKLRRIVRLDIALRYVWRSTPRLTVASVVLVIIQGPLPLLSLYLMKLFVDSVTENLGSVDLDAAFRSVMFIVVAMAGLQLLTTVVSIITAYVNQKQSLIVTDYMQGIIHAQSIAVDLEYYENPAYYDTMRRAQNEALSRPVQILRDLTNLGTNLLSITALTGLLASFHWAMILVLPLAVLPQFLVQIRYSGIMYEWRRKRTEIERQSWYFNWLLTGEQHAKEVRLFDLGSHFVTRFQDVRQLLRQEQLRLVLMQSLISSSAQLLSVLAIYGAYAFIAYRTLHGYITLGSLVMYYQAFQRGQTYLAGLLGNIAGLYDANLFLTNLEEFLSLEPHITSPPQPRPTPRPMQQGIVFEDVSFQYPTGERMVLHHIDLTIAPGQKIALVGENGSGKTTLIKLLCRLYDPTEGRITLDGIDLRDLNIDDLRREISVIFQDYAQYNLTAEENIWFGDAAVPPDRDLITAVARQSGAHDVIAGLKHGYGTVLGKIFQDGEQLSIGQWQKIALARAFLRKAQIVILDEPTSAMDARAEYEIFSSLHELTADKITVTISHRFSTVRQADCIYIIDKGRIIERGTHDELIALDGKYAFLFHTQAQHYH